MEAITGWLDVVAVQQCDLTQVVPNIRDDLDCSANAPGQDELLEGAHGRRQTNGSYFWTHTTFISCTG